MIELSRRKTLQMVIAGSALSALPFGVSATTKIPEKWDQTADLLIIGTGFAGLACAIEAQAAGIKNILVVEKMASAGGNSIINGGAVAAAGTDLQKAAGINDSAELLFKDIMRAGGYINHPKVAKLIADNSLENYLWLKDQIGVDFVSVYYHGGHSVKRSHGVREHTGAGFINPMLKKCRELNIPIQFRTKIEDLIVDETGRIIGVQARKNYRFGKEDSGRTIYIKAVNGVVLCSGGFSQNVSMRMDHDPRLTDAFGSTNHPGATGEMIQAAQMIGANTVHMDWIQLGPWTSPDERGFGTAPLFIEPLVGFGVMVDPATGKRFVKETGNRKVRADAIVALGHPALLYASEENCKNQLPKNMTQTQIDSLLANNVVRKFDTLKELAAFYKIPLQALEETNNKMNRYITDKSDPEFNCQFFEDSKPNNKGPFYACRLWPRVHHTMGGLEINEKAQVINAKGEVIPGLFAAGEVTGGVHGMVRLGTVAVADCMIVGRTAAKTAAGK